MEPCFPIHGFLFFPSRALYLWKFILSLSDFVRSKWINKKKFVPGKKDWNNGKPVSNQIKSKSLFLFQPFFWSRAPHSMLFNGIENEHLMLQLIEFLCVPNARPKKHLNWSLCDAKIVHCAQPNGTSSNAHSTYNYWNELKQLQNLFFNSMVFFIFRIENVRCIFTALIFFGISFSFRSFLFTRLRCCSWIIYWTARKLLYMFWLENSFCLIPI